MNSAAAAIAGCGLEPEPTLAFINSVLAEDIGSGDVTTAATIGPMVQGAFTVTANAVGVLAGAPLAAAVFLALDPQLNVATPIADGSPVKRGTTILTVKGSARSILTAERVALNLLGRLCGIASATAKYVDAAAGRARILDTRKTGLGTRLLDKYAVRCGGGHNHRIGLYDAVLVKDNHIAAATSITAAVNALERAGWPPAEIEVECDTAAQVDECLSCGVGQILLDNMDPAQMAEIARHVAGRAQLEASGGVDLESVAAVAASGVDFVSVGAITHSAPALNVSLNAALWPGA